MIIAERSATLWRGGPESDAKLHLSVGQVGSEPPAPGCAGHRPTVLVIGDAYVGMWVDSPDNFTGPVRDLVSELWNHLAVRQLLAQVPPSQKERLCQRCVHGYLNSTQGEPE